MNNSETYQNITEAQMWRYFAGQTTSKEEEELASWIKSDDAHKVYFHHIKDMYYGAKYGSMGNQFDCEKAFTDFESLTHKRIKSIRLRSWMAVAMIIVVLLGTGIVLYKAKNSVQQTGIVYQYTSQNAKFVLPDRSQVQLNKHSQLYYQKCITDKRAVELKGEAYFDIRHNATRPFEITVGNLKVRVLGTAFNINARNQDSIVVSVIRGRVALLSITDTTDSVIITNGQSVCFVRNAFCVVKTFPQNVLAWKAHIISFDATPMKDVVKTLEIYFDTAIVLDSKKRDQQLTVLLKEPKLDSVLQLLQVMYNLKTSRKNQAIVLTDSQRF